MRFSKGNTGCEFSDAKIFRVSDSRQQVSERRDRFEGFFMRRTRKRLPAGERLKGLILRRTPGKTTRSRQAKGSLEIRKADDCEILTTRIRQQNVRQKMADKCISLGIRHTFSSSIKRTRDLVTVKNNLHDRRKNQ